MLEGNLEGFEVEVLDLRGQQLGTSVLNGNRVELGERPDGLYFIRLRERETGQSKTHKVLKQR